LPEFPILIEPEREVAQLCSMSVRQIAAAIQHGQIPSNAPGEAFNEGVLFSQGRESDITWSTGVRYGSPNNKIMAGDICGFFQAAGETVKKYGYPDKIHGSEMEIDAELAAVVYEALGNMMTPRSAADRRCWAFFTCRLAPDVVAWRWGGANEVPKTNAEHFFSSTRNYFSYLWWMATLFRDDGDSPWSVLRGLTVNSRVAILERPGLGYDKSLCLALAKEAQARYEPNERDEAIMWVMKRVTISRSTIQTDAFDNAQRKEYVCRLFDAYKKHDEL